MRVGILPPPCSNKRLKNWISSTKVKYRMRPVQELENDYEA